MTSSFSGLLRAGALAALVAMPASIFAQSILLSAGDFALLGGTAITSTGVSGTVISNGNVGLAPGATTGITGFPPAVITGGAIIGTGGATAQARLDLVTVSNALALMPSDVNLSNQDLAGMTLTSGVYTFNAAAALNGTVTLDAQFKNNAFWVFQIGTALNTSVGAAVNIINLGTNGGSDIGLFWNAGAEIIIGANNFLAGNYLSGTSITFGSGSAGGVRALALAAVSLDYNELDVFGGPGGGDFTGGLAYDTNGAIAAIPEPAAVLWLAPLAAFGLLIWRRRQARS